MRYPVYVISKGRSTPSAGGLTARLMIRDGVDFRLVVEPHEAEAYAASYGEERLLLLPFRDLGQGSIPARNWCWEHALEAGAERHWIVDDNIRDMRRLYKGERIPINAELALSIIEDFTDRYENIGLSGPAYQMFVMPDEPVPFRLNVHVYSCILVRNDLPYRWRGRYNEDTDLCLQVLAGGYCTILTNALMADKMPSMKFAGGNTDELYAGDGRLKMARELERVWPHVVRVERRYGRPQHVVNWARFKTELIRKPEVDFASMPAVDEYGMELKEIRPAKSAKLKQMLTSPPPS